MVPGERLCSATACESMMERMGIVGAMAGELAPLLRSARAERVSGASVNLFESDRFVVGYAGMGRAAAIAACEAVVARGALSVLISAGWVGSLHAGIPVKSVQRPALVIDAESGESFEVPEGAGTLVTVGRVANAVEKQELVTRWSADTVDMEASHVARFARERRIPFACVKTVSDAHDEALPDFARFSDEGQFQTGEFVRWLMVRPRWWPVMMRMGRNSAAAARAMCVELSRDSAQRHGEG
ncbi:MAG: phosphorylase [Acidobacteriaceae bacterium]